METRQSKSCLLGANLVCLTNVKHKTIRRLKLEDLLSYLLCWTFSTRIAYIHWKHWCWSWNSNTLATWCEELIHLKRPWCWERLKVRREGVNRGWDGWMESPTQWTWVWIISGSLWWTGRPGVMQSMGSEKSWTWLSDWTELNEVVMCAVTGFFFQLAFFS